MLQSVSKPQADASAAGRSAGHACQLRRVGRTVALAGAVLPLFLIGILKFTQIEVDALKPLIGGTLWLTWLYAVCVRRQRS